MGKVHYFHRDGEAERKRSEELIEMRKKELIAIQHYGINQRGKQNE